MLAVVASRKLGRLLKKLDDAVDTGGQRAYFVNEDVGRVHILKGNAGRGVVHAQSLSVVMKAFCCSQRVDLPFRCQPQASHVRLGEDYSQKPVGIARESCNAHQCLREQVVVQGYRFQCFQGGGVYRCPLFHHGGVALSVVHLGFGSLGNFRAKVFCKNTF